MRVIIKETAEIEHLSIIDPKSGIDYIRDFIGDAGAFTDGQFEWDEAINAYVCSQETFDWWSDVIDDNQALNFRIYDLTKEYNLREVYDVVNAASDVDLEHHAACVNQALDEAFGS